MLNNITLSNDDYLFFKKNGFLKINNLIKKEYIEEILFEIKNIFNIQFENKNIKNSTFEENLIELFNLDFNCFLNSAKSCQNLFLIHNLGSCQEIYNLIKNFGIKKPNICTRPVTFINYEKTSKQQINHTVFEHQDWRSMQGSINSIVLWIPLVEINKDLGALEVSPGSHLKGLISREVENSFGRIPQEICELLNFISIESKVGDCLIFSSFLIHRSGKNITDNIRYSCHFRYNDMLEDSYIDRGFPTPYKYYPDDNLIYPELNTKDLINKIMS